MFDLGDPGLAVCHPTVLALFSDNFDKQTLDDLTMEVLESNLVDSTIYLERLEEVSVARVASAHGLLATERLLLQRLFHPQVIKEAAAPPAQVADRPGSGVAAAGRHDVYRAPTAVVAAGELAGAVGVLLVAVSSVEARARLHHCSLGAEESGEESDEGGEHDDVKGFRREVIDSIERGGDTDNLVLEINGSKHAWNITLSEVNQCVLFAVLTQGTDSAGPPAALLARAKVNVTRFLGLLRRYSSGPAKQGYYLVGLGDLVARDGAWLEVLPKVGARTD
ncbi:MAG: hypothetical protein GY813_00345 [Halieaceae bacterium]|nr:hypothetical protein [Halieaceae bacterium]